MSTAVDVVVVGCGPVGATLANLLGARDISTAVLERELDVYHLPRATHFDGEVMRVFQSIGAAATIEPHTVPIRGMHFLNADGKKLMGYESPGGQGPEGWAPDYMFWQPNLERALRTRLGERPSVALHLGVEATVLEVQDDGVRVDVRNLADGSTHAFDARYVVGCDGARSIVRAAMGSTLFDYGFDQPWLVVDGLLRRPVELPEHAIQYCDPARPATFVPHGGTHRRWELMALVGETEEELQRPERIWELLAPWVVPDDMELVRAAVYTFHALVATSWRSGSLLIAGDSAHQMPPFLGQGMSAGIRDASNLAWKLHRVLDGVSAPSLLDTYQSEREPHVRAFIEMAVSLGSIIQTCDPEVAALRDAELLGPDAEPPDAPPNPLLGPGVAPTECERLPQPVVDGVRLDEHLGDGFALVGAEVDDFVAPADLPIQVVRTNALDEWLAARDACAALVRPDRWVHGLAREPGEISGLVASLTDALRVDGIGQLIS